MTFIIRSCDACLEDALGGKARALAALRLANLPIPAWFVVPPAAFHASLTPHQKDVLSTARNAIDVRAAMDALRPNADVVAELDRALAELCPADELLAVRSSAGDEDGAEHSFAGQLDSFLFVERQHVADRVAAVWRSGFSERIFAYRRERGLPLLPSPPAVLVQRMVEAEVSGVAFGADPVSGRRGVAVVGAVYGLGTGLVSGECDADTYHVDRDGLIVQRTIAAKRAAHHRALGPNAHAHSNGDAAVASFSVPENRMNQPALSDEQIREVAELVRHTSTHFGRPQDIEWSIAAGRLFLLQSRPITSLPRTVDPEGVLNLWDNSNIAESYSGITTPLTFSFARGVYEEVYRQFCKILRVPDEVLREHDDIFRHMLGLIRGRIYYNLLSWYRLLTLLPGFKANRRFMEQMMGVKEKLPDNLVAELKAATWGQRWRDRFRFLGSLWAMMRNHFSLGRQIRCFYERLQTALSENREPAAQARDNHRRLPPDAKPQVDLTRFRPDELVAYYRSLERQLLTRWDAPLVNDFFAMIFYGVLGGVTRRWCGDAERTLQNDLLCGEGGMISAEPAQRVLDMAKTALGHAELIAALENGSVPAINDAMQGAPAFLEAYRAYLDKFGDRCLEELKLESGTLHDDPLPLLRSIGRQARRLEQQADGGRRTEATGTLEVRRRAEERVRRALRFRPLRRLLFGWVLRNARARVRDRENLRFERTRLFGRVRRIFVELGKRFYALDVLEQPRDIFYLEVNEALGFVDGTISCTDLKGLVALRKAEFDGFRRMEAPADRFETRGTVHHGNDFQRKEHASADGEHAAQASVNDEHAAQASVADERRKGLGCCPGLVRGPVRVVTDPRRAVLQAGDILVAERTDPGWIMLFPSAAGLLVERGSLLSHSAIVARELGIPAIVAIAGVTTWLKDGDWVELDGSTGEVRRIACPCQGGDGSQGVGHDRSARQEQPRTQQDGAAKRSLPSGSAGLG